MMCTKNRYITRGVKENIPPFLQNLLWYLIETMEVEEKDYLQIFHLDSVIIDDKRKQSIIHSQELFVYRKDYLISARQFVTGKIYVIENGTHYTMLLAGNISRSST